MLMNLREYRKRTTAMSSDLTFITNEQGQHLGDRFGVLLGDDTRFFDCLVGYFFISGFHKLHPALTKTEKIRILIGIKTDRATYELIQTARSSRNLFWNPTRRVRERVPGEILRRIPEIRRQLRASKMASANSWSGSSPANWKSALTRPSAFTPSSTS